MNTLKSNFFGLFSRFYLYIFARPSAQKINEKILNLTLRARGYNNYGNHFNSGELLFLEFLKTTDPKLCFDIGANEGHYCKDLLTKTNANVFAFEPLPKTYKKLKQNLHNFEERFQAFNIAIGSKEEELILYHAPEGKNENTLATLCSEAQNIDYVAKANTAQSVVQASSIDIFIKKQAAHLKRGPDFIKIDTEGYEYEVILGMAETLQKAPPSFIQLEYNRHHMFRGHTLHQFSNMLKDYFVYQLLPHGLFKVDTKDPLSNIYQFSNFIFSKEPILTLKVY